eukprot:gene15486-biopygen9715
MEAHWIPFWEPWAGLWTPQLGCSFRAFVEFCGSPDAGRDPCWAPRLAALEGTHRKKSPLIWATRCPPKNCDVPLVSPGLAYGPPTDIPDWGVFFAHSWNLWGPQTGGMISGHGCTKREFWRQMVANTHRGWGGYSVLLGI